MILYARREDRTMYTIHNENNKKLVVHLIHAFFPPSSPPTNWKNKVINVKVIFNTKTKFFNEKGQ